MVTDKTESEVKRTYIRIHVHEAIAEVWISPDKLTVQRGLDDFYFSVRARFTDDVVAQISPIYYGNFRSAVTTYNITPSNSIQWSSPTANLIDVNTGKITPLAGVALGEHEVGYKSINPSFASLLRG